MPYVQIDLCQTLEHDAKRALAERIGDLYADAMQTQARIVNVAFRELGVGNLWRCDGPGGALPITVILLDVRAGRPPNQREAFVERLVALVAAGIGVETARVVAYVTEHDGRDMYRDDAVAPDWQSAEAVK